MTTRIRNTLTVTLVAAALVVVFYPTQSQNPTHVIALTQAGTLTTDQELTLRELGDKAEKRNMKWRKLDADQKLGKQLLQLVDPDTELPVLIIYDNDEGKVLHLSPFPGSVEKLRGILNENQTVRRHHGWHGVEYAHVDKAHGHAVSGVLAA